MSARHVSAGRGREFAVVRCGVPTFTRNVSMPMRVHFHGTSPKATSNSERPSDPVDVADALAEGRRDVHAQKLIPAIRRLWWPHARAPRGEEDLRALMLTTFGVRD